MDSFAFSSWECLLIAGRNGLAAASQKDSEATARRGLTYYCADGEFFVRAE
jgi:hypothetical protein